MEETSVVLLQARKHESVWGPVN